MFDPENDAHKMSPEMLAAYIHNKWQVPKYAHFTNYVALCSKRGTVVQNQEQPKRIVKLDPIKPAEIPTQAEAYAENKIAMRHMPKLERPQLALPVYGVMI